MSDYPLWDNEQRRAVELLGGEATRFKRMTTDRVILEFTQEEWMKLFNVSEEFKPCRQDFTVYKMEQPIQIYFVRDKVQGHGDVK